MTWRQKTGLEQFWFNFGQFWSENWCDCQARETVQLLPRRCLCGIWYLGHPWTNDDLFLVLKLGQLRCWIGGQLSICWHWYIHFWWPVTGTSGFFSKWWERLENWNHDERTNGSPTCEHSSHISSTNQTDQRCWARVLWSNPCFSFLFTPTFMHLYLLLSIMETQNRSW